MSSKVDWNALTEQTHKISQDVIKANNEWLLKHPDWTCKSFFVADYPPRFIGKYILYGVNSLSDMRKSEIGELTTLLCTKFGLIGKKDWVSDCGKNEIAYKFYLPIKEKS